MRLPAPISYSLEVLVGQWRLWMSLAWLPLAGAAAVTLLQASVNECIDARGIDCFADVLPYGAARALAAWSGLLIYGLYGLCFVPAITALYRRLLTEPDATGAARIRLSGAELRYAGYSLLFFYLTMVMGQSLWFLLWPHYVVELGTLPQPPGWFVAYVGHPLQLLVILLLLLALARFYLVLPDAALGRRGRFLDLFAHSRGNVLAIVLALVVVRMLSIIVRAAIDVPGGLAVELVQGPSVDTASIMETVIVRVASFADDYVRAVGSAAVLAWFYRRLVMSREE